MTTVVIHHYHMGCIYFERPCICIFANFHNKHQELEGIKLMPHPVYSLDLAQIITCSGSRLISCAFVASTTKRRWNLQWRSSLLWRTRNGISIGSKNWQKVGFTQHIVWTKLSRIITYSDPWLTSCSCNASTTKMRWKLQGRSSSPQRIRNGIIMGSKNW